MEDRIRHSQYESPLRYHGGKACLFRFISNLFHENDLIGSDYTEPYAGGSGLASKLFFNEFVNQIHINDFDYSIYCFWKTLLDSNTRFCDWIENVYASIENWRYFKYIQKNNKIFSEYEVAQSIFF